jgi:hypothetical protein
MDANSTIVQLSELCRESLGVFRGRDAVGVGVTRKRLAVLHAAGVIDRELPDVYRLTSVLRSPEQGLRAALLWGGDTAAVDGLSAAQVYALEGVRTDEPEIAISHTRRARSSAVVAHRIKDPAVLMVRQHRGFRVVGPERALVSVAHRLPGEAFEIACEDARRRRLTTVAALRAYLTRFGGQRLPGAPATHALLCMLDPVHPSRSTLEVMTRRLLVSKGLVNFQREFPLSGGGACTGSTSRSSRREPSWRRTAAAGMTTRSTTNATTRSGACPATTGTGSSSRRGTRSPDGPPT